MLEDGTFQTITSIPYTYMLKIHTHTHIVFNKNKMLVMQLYFSFLFEQMLL